MAKPVSITSSELVSVIHKIIIDKFHEADSMGYLHKNDINEMFTKLGLFENKPKNILSMEPICKMKSNENNNCEEKCCKNTHDEYKEINSENNNGNNIKIISYKKHPKKPSVNLPFCNIIVKQWCYGIKLNHGLYTQCHLKKVKGCEYCKTCLKQSKKNKNNLPNSGDIRSRKFNITYIAPNRKKQKKYSEIVNKQKIDIKFAIREAKKLNWTIPENEMKDIKPVKVSPVVSDTSDEEDVEIIDSKIKKASKEFEKKEEDVKKEEEDVKKEEEDIKKKEEDEENISLSDMESDDGSDSDDDDDTNGNDDKFNNFEIKIIRGNKYYFDEKGESNIKDKDGNIIKNLLLEYDEGIPVGIYNEKKIKPLDY